MVKLSKENEVHFFEFLSNQIDVHEFKRFVYENESLESEMDSQKYNKLISFNFKNVEEVLNELVPFISNEIIEESSFFVWKIKNRLELFLNEPENIKEHLDEMYNLYFGISDASGKVKFAFPFLGNLALNYFYWLEEDYLKLYYGSNWKSEYEKIVKNFSFYHEQLIPYAQKILSAINNKEIEFFNDGTYFINQDLKRILESDDVYQLKYI